MVKVGFSYWVHLISEMQNTIAPATEFKEIEVVDEDSEDDQDSDN